MTASDATSSPTAFPDTLHRLVLRGISEMGFKAPTPIQAAFIPAALGSSDEGEAASRDFIGLAPSAPSSAPAADALKPLCLLRPYSHSPQPGSYSATQPDCYVSALHWSPLHHEILVVAYANSRSDNLEGSSSIVIWYRTTMLPTSHFL